MTKKCTKCGAIKPLVDFSILKRYSKNPPPKSMGRNSWCVDCVANCQRQYYLKNIDKARSRSKAWRLANHEKYLLYMRDRHHQNPRRSINNNLKRNYGITLEKYEEILAEQDGCCACCYAKKTGAKGKRLSVDHCHRTGRIRGILCGRCNLVIGQLNDNPNLALEMVNYLIKHKTHEELCPTLL